MLTLWDLIEPVLRRGQRKKPQASPPKKTVAPPPAPVRRKNTEPMQAKYDAVVEQMLEKYQIRVRKWRSGMTGIAWYVTYKDGRQVRLIEAPRPKGPMSAAVFL